MSSANLPASLDGRFRVLRMLWVEAEARTLLVEDTRSAAPCILKALSETAVNTQLSSRVADDVTRLGDSACPYLAVPIHVQKEKGLLYVARPFVPGITLAERLESGPLSVSETLDVGTCVLEALAHMHVRGVLHRDVRPANVVLSTPAAGTSSSEAPAAVLVHRGLARSERMDLELRQLSPSIVRAISPEQAGVVDQEVKEPSDLYSTGVLLYECLAGKPLLSAASAREIVHEMVTAVPLPLRSLGIDVPGPLDELIQRLLRKDARERYGTARAVLADLRSIRAGERAPGAPRTVLGGFDPRRTLAQAGFTGRQSELDALRSQLQEARRGAGGLVVVEGLSGGGKSRLLEELALRAASWGMWVLRGQGIDQRAARPFELLSGLVRELRSLAGSDPETARAIGARVGDGQQAVCDALPLITPIFGVRPKVSLGPERHAESRSITALSAMLDALGSLLRPALVVLDDAQWADEQTVRLLAHWAQGRAARAARSEGHVLVVVSYRSEEVRAGHPLRELKASTRLVLQPFDREEISRLVESMAGPLPAAAVDTVSELSRGSPFMAIAVLRGMSEGGALLSTPDGWRVNRQAMADLRASRQAAPLLVRRLGWLPAPVSHLLSVGAVLGKEFPLALAAELAGQSLEQAGEVIGEARARELVWPAPDGSACVFVHDKLREALLERLDPNERRELHRRAAEAIEAQEAEQAGVSLHRELFQRMFEIAYHFDAAGDHERALPSALLAADRARRRHALEVAEEQYRIAARASSADSRTRQRIAEGLGDVLMLRGRYDKATAQFDQARALARDNVERAQIQAKLGEVAFKRGDVAAASASLEHGLRLLGMVVPRTRTAFVVLVAWELLVQLLHSGFPGVFLARRSRRKERAGADELLAVRLYSRLTYAYWFQRGTVACGWAHLREMNLAERYDADAELAQAYSNHAPVAGMIGRFERGATYAQRSLEIRRSLGDVWGQGQSLAFYGAVRYAASEFAEGSDACREAMTMLARTGDRWEHNTAAWHVALCSYRAGDLRGATGQSREVHTRALEIGDDMSAGISLGIWSRASRGRVPGHLVESARAALSEDVHTTAEVHMAAAVRFLREGQPREAVQVLSDADAQIRAKGFHTEYVAPVACWLVTALRAELDATPAWDPRGRRAILRRAKGVARRALRVAIRFRNNLPHALRERAWLYALDGRHARARAALEESMRVATEQGARHEHLLSQEAWGRIGEEVGWPGARSAHDEARRRLADVEAELGELEVPVERGRSATISLADRFSSVVETGHRIACALSEHDVLAGVRDAARALLRGERFYSFRVEADAPVFDVESEDRREQALLTALAEQAVERGTTVLLDGESEAVQELATLSGTRSALCAPIAVRGHIVHGFCVTHREIAGLFRTDEAELARHVTSLAGAALENAAGFTALQAAHESLAAQYAVTRILAESATLVEAGGKLLEEMCRRLDWQVGALWTADGPDGLMRCREVWCHEDDRYDAFDAATRALSFERGEGLVGSVWASGAPWCGALTDAPSFKRADVARAAGLAGGLVFPVGHGSDTLGVIELFSSEMCGQDDPRLATKVQIGSQIGQFAFRRRAEEERNMLAYARSLVEQLRASEMRLAEAQHIARVGSWEWDFTSDRVNWSDEMYHLYGLDPRTPAAFGGTLDALLQLAHPRDQERLRAAIQRAYRQQAPFQLEHEVTLANGTTRSLHVRGKVVVPEDGSPPRVVGTAQDISERKEVELLKTEFVSVVSHELRTPLTSIRGALGLMEGGVLGELPPNARSLVEIARANSDRLIRLINDLLDLDKIEAGKLELTLSELDPAEVVSAAMASVSSVAEEAGVTVKVATDGPRRIRADHDRVQQVLINLVANAIKFSPRGSSVEVAVEVAPSALGRVRFSVRDDGPGITGENAKKLFRRFQQLDSSNSKTRGGSGLGLAISKAIVEAHGGEIGVVSTPGSGSTFWFELPLAAAPRALRVLIADDEACVRERLSWILSRQLRCECIEAGDGLQVVHLVRSLQPDLIILDVGMPGLDGFAVIKRLRQEASATTPLIVYTARDLTRGERHMLSLGPTRHLDKVHTTDDALVEAARDLTREPPQSGRVPSVR